ncbi:MAG: hypothetical protein K2H19_06165 [Ruminococcus sp.]|nr:hypothetical protein [Ruminococcus sp.]
MALIQLCFSFLIFCVAIGSLVSIFVFIIDVIKWHKKEERVKIVPSVQKLPDELTKESEVKEDAPRDNNRNRGDNSDSSSDNSANAGQSSASALFDSWL